MRKFTVVAIMLLVISAGLRGQTFTNSGCWGKSGFTLTETKSNSVQVVFSVPEFTLQDVQADGQTMKAVSIPGVFLPNDEGMPNLPGTGKYIAIPQGSTPVVNIVSQRTDIIHNVSIAPAPQIPLENEPDHALVKDAVTYSTNAFYPSSPVKISGIEQIRGVDVVTLGITPFQYNPVTKDLIIYKDLKVEVSFNGGNNQYGNTSYRNRYWDPILADNIMNFASLPVIDYDKRFQTYPKSPLDNECEYIIITPTGPDFLHWADSIANFRNQQGVLTHVFTLTDVGGNTETAIEAFINNAYHNWTIKPVACLLLGDYGTDGTKNIITHLYTHPAGYPDFASDNMYADVDGDEMPDVIFSRIAANDATQLQVICSKFLNYERNPPTDANFYDKPITALGWASDRWFQLCSEIVGGFWKNVMNKHPRRINAVYAGSTSAWSTATNTQTIINYFGPTGLNYIPTSPNTLGGWTGGNAAQINAAVDSGAFILIHRDHGAYTEWGEPSYSTANISQLTNTLLPFVFSINCETGAYHNPSGCPATCFSEAFQRLTYGGHNAGALGLVCPSEVSYSFVNDTFVWGMMDNMWPSFMPNETTNPPSRGVLPAFANAAGKYFLKQSNWPYNAGDKLVTYRLFHMHGDAFQVIYAEIPQNLSVNHDPSIEAGSTSFTISADQDALIALSVNNQIIATGTGTGNAAAITIPAQPVGTQVLVTVTKQNFFRYSAHVPVISSALAANFSANVTNTCVGSSVNFTDLSGGHPTGWNWTFEGGTPATSTEQNPTSIVYSTPGTYAVSLTVVKDTATNSFSEPAYIHVNKLPVAAFAATTVCVGNPTVFTDLSNANGGTLTDWLWSFGDPNSSANMATDQNTSHIFSTSGTFNVTLTTTNNGACPNAITQAVNVMDIPLVAAVPTGTSEICQASQDNTFTTTGSTFATSYTWEVMPAEAGTFTGNDLETHFSVADTFSGPAIIRVRGTNDCGLGAFSGEYAISVLPLPEAPAQPSGPASVDSYKTPSTDFTTTAVTGATGYVWNLTSAAGTISGTDITGSVTWNPAFRGAATITVQCVNACQSPVSIEKTVNVTSTLAVGEHGNSNIRIYPNPTTGKLSIEVKATGTVLISLFNTIGVKTFAETDNVISGKLVKTIDLSGMPGGIYYLKVEGDTGSTVQKIILQR